jgi:hypothetical protein
LNKAAIWENNSDPLAGNTVVSDGTSRATVVLKFVFTEPSSGHTCTLQMSQVQLKNPKPMRDKDYVRVEADFTAEANTTDAVGGGYSPIKTTTVNAINATY